jgi:hypothetical protein
MIVSSRDDPARYNADMSQPNTAITPTAPDVIMLSGRETIDGEAHEAVCSIVYFSTAEERRLCEDATAYFEVEQNGRTFYGAEMVYYLD